jgi:hypothetical protein
MKKKVKATDDVHHTQLHIEDLDEWFVELMSYESYWSGTTHAESHIPPVSEVILCGSRATTPGLDEWVGERLQLPTSVANVWGNMFSFNDVIPRIPQKDSTQYATVNGLLLSNISNIW